MYTDVTSFFRGQANDFFLMVGIFFRKQNLFPRFVSLFQRMHQIFFSPTVHHKSWPTTKQPSFEPYADISFQTNKVKPKLKHINSTYFFFPLQIHWNPATCLACFIFGLIQSETRGLFGLALFLHWKTILLDQTSLTFFFAPLSRVFFGSKLKSCRIFVCGTNVHCRSI